MFDSESTTPHSPYFMFANVGNVNDFDPTAQYLRTVSMRNQLNPAEMGECWLELSLTSLHRISNMSIRSGPSLNRSGRNQTSESLDNAKREYDLLQKEGKEIQNRQATKSKFWNPLESRRIKRDMEAWESKSHTFYRKVNKTSEEFRRGMLSVENLRARVLAEQSGSTLPSDQRIAGIAVNLPSDRDPDPHTMELFRTAARQLEFERTRISRDNSLPILHEDRRLHTNSDHLNGLEETSQPSLGPSGSFTRRATIDGNIGQGDRYQTQFQFSPGTVINNPTYIFGGQGHNGAIPAPTDPSEDREPEGEQVVEAVR